VCRYDGTTFTRFPEVVGLTANDVYNIFTDRAGNVWIGAIGVGAYRVDGASFTLFDQTDRPDLTKTYGIQSFVEDRRGTLWFGFSGGLFRFNGNGFTNVTRGGPWSGP
jgi:ligand-binding sensor domain-containing protein